MNDKLACGCVLRDPFPRTHPGMKRIAQFRCEQGRFLWKKYLSIHLDRIQRSPKISSDEREALARYDAHIQPKTGGDDA